MDTQTSTNTNPRINVEELVKSFKVPNEEAFGSYLKEVWLVRKDYL